MSIELAVIGGTGLYRFPGLEDIERHHVETPYGKPSGDTIVGTVAGKRVAFLARHGESHSIAPHRINYRANVWTLHRLGARRIVGINAVGGIREDMGPRVIAVPDQIIDYTWGRPSTFFEGAEQPVTHIDFTHPYDEDTRQLLVRSAKAVNVPLHVGGTYAAVQGPRLETKAEIDRLDRDGATMVGMTGMPEAALARELKLRYAALTVVVNPAAGRGSSAKSVSLEDIGRVIEETMAKVRMIVEKAVEAHHAGS